LAGAARHRIRNVPAALGSASKLLRPRGFRGVSMRFAGGRAESMGFDAASAMC
jgi:hypothetical protein